MPSSRKLKMHMTSACRIPPIRPKILMNLAKQKTWPRLTWEIKPEIWIILNASCLAFLFGAPPTQTMASNYGASQIRLSNNSVCARRSTKCEECEPDEHGAFRNVVQLGNWGKIGKIGVAWKYAKYFPAILLLRLYGLGHYRRNSTFEVPEKN